MKLVLQESRAAVSASTSHNILYRKSVWWKIFLSRLRLGLQGKHWLSRAAISIASERTRWSIPMSAVILKFFRRRVGVLLARRRGQLQCQVCFPVISNCTWYVEYGSEGYSSNKRRDYDQIFWRTVPPILHVFACPFRHKVLPSRRKTCLVVGHYHYCGYLRIYIRTETTF